MGQFDNLLFDVFLFLCAHIFTPIRQIVPSPIFSSFPYSSSIGQTGDRFYMACSREEIKRLRMLKHISRAFSRR